MTAVLNHGGLSAEKSEAIALLLVHAPLGENPLMADHLGMSDKLNLISEVETGYKAGTLPLKYFGLN